MTIQKINDSFCQICNKMKHECLRLVDAEIIICKDCIKLLNRFIS